MPEPLVGARTDTARKIKQEKYYNQHSHQLPPLQPGDVIRVKLHPDSRHHQKGICTKHLGNRKYEIEVDGRRYIRNQRFLIKTNENPPMSYPIDDDEFTQDQQAETGLRRSSCRAPRPIRLMTITLN